MTEDWGEGHAVRPAFEARVFSLAPNVGLTPA